MDPDAQRSDADRLLGRTASLARAVQRGDLGQFDELYDRTAPALYAWAALRAPPNVDPGDILGEVWLRAVDRLRSQDSENHEFRAWIFGIAKHVLLQLLRARGTDPTANVARSHSGLSTNGLERFPDSVTSISQRLEREDTLKSFLQYAQHLDADDRDLLLYCGLEGSTCADAATRLGLTEATAAKRWQRLRAELRDSAWVRDLLLS